MRSAAQTDNNEHLQVNSTEVEAVSSSEGCKNDTFWLDGNSTEIESSVTAGRVTD